MIAQALITDIVNDNPIRFSHSVGMLTHDEIRDELIRQIAAKKVKQADVARALGIAPARVAEMKNKDRRVQPEEMEPLARLLGLAADNEPQMRSVQSVSLILNLGKVAQGVWLEETEMDHDNLAFVPYDRRPGDPSPEDLFSVTPEGTSMNLAFHPGTDLICRRIPFGTGSLKAGDYVIARRTAHDLHEMTCKRVEVDDDGVFWLHSESDDPRYQEPWRIGCPDEGHHTDIEVGIIAKVIRAVRNLEK